MPLSRLQLRHNTRLDFDIVHYGKDYDKSVIELLHALFSNKIVKSLLEECKVKTKVKQETFESDLYKGIKESKRRSFINAQDLYHNIQRRFPSSSKTLSFCSEYNRIHLKKDNINDDILECLTEVWLEKGGFHIVMISHTATRIVLKLALINYHQDKVAIVAQINTLLHDPSFVIVFSEAYGKLMLGVARFLFYLDALIGNAIESCIGTEASHALQQECEEIFNEMPKDILSLGDLMAGVHLLCSFQAQLGNIASTSDTL